MQLDPTLTSQLSGIVLHDLAWRGRRFTVAIGSRTTTVTLDGGAALPVSTPSGSQTLGTGATLTLATRRRDLTPTRDAVRCGAATASTSQLGAPALAAVDGSPATDWQPVSLPATLTAPVRRGVRRVRTATLRWGQQWPPAPAPNVPPPPGPVTTLRASSYTLLVSTDGHSWRIVAFVTGRTSGTTDLLHFAPVHARYLQVRITASTGGQPPMLEELTVTG